VNGVVEAPLPLFRQPVKIDIGLRYGVQQRKINRRSYSTLPGMLGEKILLLPLFCEDCSESGLDSGAPRLIEVVVSGGLEALQLPDEVVLALLEVGDLRRERGRGPPRSSVAGSLIARARRSSRPSPKTRWAKKRCSGAVSSSSRTTTCAGWVSYHGRWAWFLGSGLHR
jgi:hypothetical protein